MSHGNTVRVSVSDLPFHAICMTHDFSDPRTALMTHNQFERDSCQSLTSSSYSTIQLVYDTIGSPKPLYVVDHDPAISSYRSYRWMICLGEKLCREDIGPVSCLYRFLQTKRVRCLSCWCGVLVWLPYAKSNTGTLVRCCCVVIISSTRHLPSIIRPAQQLRSIMRPAESINASRMTVSLVIAESL
jgi:hypothetical protein